MCRIVYNEVTRMFVDKHIGYLCGFRGSYDGGEVDVNLLGCKAMWDCR